MSDEDFTEYLLKRLDCIDKKLSELRERITKIETAYTWIIRLLAVLIIIVSGKAALLHYLHLYL